MTDLRKDYPGEFEPVELEPVKDFLPLYLSPNFGDVMVLVVVISIGIGIVLCGLY